MISHSQRLSSWHSMLNLSRMTMATPIQSKWPVLFDGLGCLTSVTHQPLIDVTVKSVIQPLRCIPSLSDEVSAELQRLQEDGIIKPNSVQQALRGWVLLMVHEGHLGILRVKQRCHDLVWWPGIDRDIKALISGIRAHMAKCCMFTNRLLQTLLHYQVSQHSRNSSCPCSSFNLPSCCLQWVPHLLQ